MAGEAVRAGARTARQTFGAVRTPRSAAAGRSTRALGAAVKFAQIIVFSLALTLHTNIASADSGPEVPAVAPLCDVLANPGGFDHKLVQVSGEVSRGFEDFMLSDTSCKSKNLMWLEIGGTVGSEVVYCCGDNNIRSHRKSALVVEGITTTLVMDKNFVSFQSLTSSQSQYACAVVTLLGRYFSGRETQTPTGKYWMGYGHFGMASLLVIQQVISVAPCSTT